MSGGAQDPHPKSAEVASLSAAELGGLFDDGSLTSLEVTELLVARIEAIDHAGPHLRSVLELAPDVLDRAAELDADRRAGKARGPLHGVPVLVKDNVDTATPLHTTAGSFALADGGPGLDARVVEVLRGAGALVLGKANLSEWANFRGRPSSSGWSAVGGQTRNPHALDRSPGGSSAGSGAAVGARLVPLAVGTETDGSVLCPSAACGIAGLKPTVGLVSRTGIVPISGTQDTAGPMARTTKDLALLLEALAAAVDDGEDGAARTDRRPPGYDTRFATMLGDGRLERLRVGVLRGGYVDYHPPTDRVFATSLDALSAAGARLVELTEGLPDPSEWADAEMTVLLCEFRAGMAAYLDRRARTSAGGTSLPRSLADLAAHARADARERTDLFGIDSFERGAVAADLDSEEYQRARETCRKAARDALDRLFADQEVDVLIAPAMHPAWPIDHVLGDQAMGSAWSPAAVAGYPSATVPVGAIEGLPVGVAVLGPAWSEARLLGVLAALERALGPEVTQPRPGFRAASTALAG